MEKYVRKHEVVPIENGFRIIPRIDTVPKVQATVDGYGFWHIYDYGNEDREDFEEINKYNDIPFYAFGELLDSCVHYMYKDWAPKPPEGKEKWVHPAISNWAKKKTASALNHRVHNIWENLVEQISPEILGLHKKLYSTAGGAGNWENVKKAFDKGDEYLLEDMVNYHAARIAILGCNENIMKEKSWMVAFSSTEKINTSLRKTLMQLPYGIAYFDAIYLNQIELPEPATTRLKLLAYSTLARYYGVGNYGCNENVREREEAFKHVLLKSTEEDIKNAIRYMWHYFPNEKTGDFRRLRQIKSTLSMIFDYRGEIGDWDILGLAKRSEEYHHNVELQQRIQAEEREKRRAQNDKEYARLISSNTMLPPIPLPENPSIKFLDTYQSVVNEGKIMEHCIAQYADRAVYGHSYLFHIDYEGEMASVEVDSVGYVQQSYGKRDCSNKASEYGRKELNKWAKNLKGKSIKQPKANRLALAEPF